MKSYRTGKVLKWYQEASGTIYLFPGESLIDQTYLKYLPLKNNGSTLKKITFFFLFFYLSLSEACWFGIDVFQMHFQMLHSPSISISRFLLAHIRYAVTRARLCHTQTWTTPTPLPPSPLALLLSLSQKHSHTSSITQAPWLHTIYFRGGLRHEPAKSRTHRQLVLALRSHTGGNLYTIYEKVTHKSIHNSLREVENRFGLSEEDLVSPF